MKKTIIGIAIMMLLVGCSFTTESQDSKTDASLFKEEYESLNNKESGYGDNNYRALNIGDDNPFVYSTADEILEKIDNKETFVVYFGFASCPWCRSVISNLIDVAADLGITTIYYVDVLEIRDTLTLDNEGKVVIENKGTEAYYQLLEKLEIVLDDYILTDEDGNEVNTQEKRIYAPNIISVVDGVATKMTTGISDKQTDAYMELTSEINEESYDKIKCVIECAVEAKAVCNAKAKC